MVPTFQTLWPCCGPHHASRSLSPRSRPLGDLRPPLRPRPRPSRRRRRYVAAASHHGVGHARALPPLAFEPPSPPPPLPPSCLVVLVVHVNTSWPLPGSRPTKTIVVFASPLLLSLLFLPHRETQSNFSANFHPNFQIHPFDTGAFPHSTTFRSKRTCTPSVTYRRR